MKDKIYYIEILRIMSMLSVVLLHVASTAWFYVDMNTLAWYTYNAVRCACKWGVTVFVMISGALFLRKETISISVLWKKYIKRIVLILLFWSFAYAVFPAMKILLYSGDIRSWNWRGGVKAFILGENHLWYLYMCIGLYMMIPFMKEIAKKRSLLKYFIGLSVVVTILLPMFQKVSFFMDSIWNQWIGKFSIQMVVGYPLYFMLGYYWSSGEITKKKRCSIYWAASIMFVISIYLTSSFEGKHFLVDGTMSVGNFVITNAIFVLGTQLLDAISPKSKVIEWINKASSLSLGIYLVHMFFVRDITKWAVANFNSSISVMIVTTGMVLLCSTAVCLLMKRIPWVSSLL